MRVRKDPDIRRTELIAASMELFSTVGYENTTVTDIVKKAGVAKGTFFYYFPAKEAVLETIISNWASELGTTFKEKSRNLPAIDQLQIFIDQMLQPSQLDVLCNHLLTEVQFNLLYKLWQQQILSVFNPLLTGILQLGIQQGTMQIEYPNEAIVFFWSTLNCLWEASYAQESAEILIIKKNMAETILERLLGLPEGTIKISTIQYSA